MQMDDNELAQIRARRLAELQGQHGVIKFEFYAYKI